MPDSLKPEHLCLRQETGNKGPLRGSLVGRSEPPEAVRHGSLRSAPLRLAEARQEPPRVALGELVHVVLTAPRRATQRPSGMPKSEEARESCPAMTGDDLSRAEAV